MNCKTKLVLFWMCAGFAAVRMWGPWFESPLERVNWVFLILFLTMLGWSSPNAFKSNERCAWSALFAVVPAAVIYVGGFFMNVNAAVVAGGIGLWWSAAWLLGGWRTAWRFLPAFTVLLLTIPGLGYWLGVFTGLEPWIVKTSVCGLAMVWLAAVRRWNFMMSPESVAFLAVALLSLSVYFSGGMQWRRYDEVNPDFSGTGAPEYLGRRFEPDEVDRRFFAGSTVDRYYFVAPDDGGIDVLEVSRIADVHQIHPAGYCLRAGGFAVETDVLREVELSGGRKLQVNSLIAEKHGRRVLVWAWYERPGFATGSFMRFRRGRAQDWRTVLLSTAIDGVSGQTTAEKRLADFVDRISGANQPDK